MVFCGQSYLNLMGPKRGRGGKGRGGKKKTFCKGKKGREKKKRPFTSLLFRRERKKQVPAPPRRPAKKAKS